MAARGTTFINGFASQLSSDNASVLEACILNANFTSFFSNQTSDDATTIKNAIYSYFSDPKHFVYYSGFTSNGIIGVNDYFNLYSWLNGLMSMAKELDVIRFAFNVSGCNSTQTSVYQNIVSAKDQLMYPYQV
jgi:hypothetical protein